MRGPASLPGRVSREALRRESLRGRIGLPSWLTSTMMHSALICAALSMSRAQGCTAMSGPRGGAGGANSARSIDGGFGGHAIQFGDGSNRLEQAAESAAANAAQSTEMIASVPVASEPVPVPAAPEPAIAPQLPEPQPFVTSIAPAQVFQSSPLAPVLPLQMAAHVETGQPREFPTQNVSNRQTSGGPVANTGQSGSGSGGGPGGDGLGESGRGRGRGEPGTGNGGTSIFGLEDTADRIVYIVDTSLSMTEHHALRRAKAELMRSLMDLGPTQQFQVIFSSTEQVLKLDAGRYPMFFGGDISRQVVARQMASVIPDGGTDHKGAIRTALALRPTAIFYISDGGEPLLSAKDVQDLSRLNTGARIHCVQFGTGVLLKGSSADRGAVSMQRLAQQNGGRYTYYDLLQPDSRD